MKNLLVFLIIFVCGAVSYGFLNNLLSQNSTPQIDTKITQNPAIISSSTEKKQESTLGEEKVESKPPVDTISEYVDGPFTVFTNNDKETDATVRIIRSPEEIVLQFEHVTEDFPIGSFVYLSDDVGASHYINLGTAQFTNEEAVYGLPPQWNQDTYPFILIYDTSKPETVLYAKMVQ